MQADPEQHGAPLCYLGVGASWDFSTTVLSILHASKPQ